MQQPSWLDHAWRGLGTREAAGAADNATIAGYFRDAGHARVKDDEVAWCAAFLGACLARGGVAGSGSLLARSYLDWGTSLDEARLGAVAVLMRGGDEAQGHVGFVVGVLPDALYLLGGNQGDAVSVARFDRGDLLGLRWPAVTPAATDRGEAPTAMASSFEDCLPHVLEMEGGYTEDPYDPGGPTNQGITLAVFAAWQGVTLDANNAAEMKAALKRIAPEVVRAIYLKRYWEPSRAAELPAPLAFIHFDAAVNHGVGGAARMLQQAVGAAVDGEIGPETLAKAAAIAPAKAVAAYAEIRRERYRALPHFWRFGRGWLARVDTTASRASARVSPQDAKDKQTMQIDLGGGTGTKWWGQSMTIWGAIITALATVLPTLGPVIGIDITAEFVRQMGGQVAQAVQAVIGLIGTLMTIWGRIRASQPIERREVTLRL